MLVCGTHLPLRRQWMFQNRVLATTIGFWACFVRIRITRARERFDTLSAQAPERSSAPR
jgi:hypothetical protein